MKSDFSLKEIPQAIDNSVVLNGYINEFATFTNISIKPVVRIVLAGVTGMNSIGTRSWCQWIKTIPEQTTIWIEQAPVMMVKAFGQVQGALPLHAKMVSFFVPYYSDASGESRDVLFVRDQHFNPATGIVQPPQVLDSKNKPMEMDVAAEVYFNFLRPS